ncbi:hypothetical protein DN730_15225 [Marinomonas piezotolerans]|uniref:Lipoprotein n=1 Tax=Marinomonas piezotolerans TaxID=2213058 RepID=A0A370U6B3_9GAMM|nr:hypothetical protein [Marinomonas piezotolerans]RDL43324.1 hypothetical protein DN730_15225 [Marinomonas piezotolerans]
MSKTIIVKLVCCILVMIGASACTTINSQDAFEQARNEQQVQLAQILESLWERAHIIPKLQQGAPLTSTTKSGQSSIQMQNARNLEIAKAKLEELNRRLAQRKSTPSTGDLATLQVLAVTSDKQTHYIARPLAIYRSEEVSWRFTSQEGEVIDLRVVWNEDGNLYIEGQNVMDLNPSSSDIPFATQVFYYGDQVLAKASLNLVLQAQVPRL